MFNVVMNCVFVYLSIFSLFSVFSVLYLLLRKLLIAAKYVWIWSLVVLYFNCTADTVNLSFNIIYHGSASLMPPCTCMCTLEHFKIYVLKLIHLTKVELLVTIAITRMILTALFSCIFFKILPLFYSCVYISCRSVNLQ